MLSVLAACSDSTMQAGAEWLREPDLDDVQNIYHNLEVTEELMEAMEEWDLLT